MNEARNERKELNSTDLLEALRYVANNAQKSPSDSVRDMCNEAFEICNIPLMALWSTDSNMPIQFLPSNRKGVSFREERTELIRPTGSTLLSSVGLGVQDG